MNKIFVFKKKPHRCGWISVQQMYVDVGNLWIILLPNRLVETGDIPSVCRVVFICHRFILCSVDVNTKNRCDTKVKQPRATQSITALLKRAPSRTHHHTNIMLSIYRKCFYHASRCDKYARRYNEETQLQITGK